MIASGVTNIVLLVVGAAWVAVLVPPLLRSRVENRPGSSIVDFRRQLASLQRTVPTRGVTTMQQMARPLAPSAGVRRHGAVREHVARGHRVSIADHAPVHRGVAAQHHHHVQTQIHRRQPAPVVSSRHLVQQRRQNVLFVLVGVTLASALLAFATANSVLTYVFVLSAISLAGYCYKLVQLKNAATIQSYGSLRR